MKKTFNYIFLIIIILSIFFSNNCFATQILENTVVEVYSEAGQADFSTIDIHSNCILLIEKNTGDVLYEKNGYQKMYPASTTKILTAILVLENCDVNEIATVSSVALKAVPPTYTTSNLQIRGTVAH